MRVDLAGWTAGVLLAGEGAALAVLAALQVVAIAGSDTAEISTAIALLVLTLIGAAAVVAFGVATIRDLSWGRSGGIVVQLLILAVAGGAATGSYAHPLVGLGLAVPAVVVFVLLVVAVRRAAQRKGSPPSGEPSR